MANIVGVRFKTAGKVYYFDPLDYDVKRGSHVIVETVRGVEYGTVITGPKEVPDGEVVQPLKEIIRVATDDDDARETYNRIREHEAYLVCKEKIRDHNLEMKLIKAEYTFDNNKLIFYFTADGRVDFRGLVKDLAGVFRTRIELRQIGVRDETKLLGGVGICGRDLCCHTFLSGFAPVSIRMAKEQNLSLNPAKISGVCGRLMCCLKNEAETYEYLNSRLPRNGEWVTTPDGMRGEVYGTNVLRQTVRVLIQVDDEKDIRTFPVEELVFRSGTGAGRQKRGGHASDAKRRQAEAKGTPESAPAEKQDGSGREQSAEYAKNRSASGRDGKTSKDSGRRSDGSGRRKSKNKGTKSSGQGGQTYQSGSRSVKERSDRNEKNEKNGKNSKSDGNSKRRYSSRKNRNRSSEKKNE